MKIAVVTEPYRVEIQEAERPELGPCDVCIRVEAAGICGSDLHLYKGTHAFRKPPAVLGHEVAGTIIEVGGAVTRFRVGDHVTVEPQVGCGECRFCKDGRINLCANKKVPGTPAWLGTFAEYFAAPERTVYKLADGVSSEAGSLVEPLAVAIHAMGMAGQRKKGGTIAILGCGTIGLACVAVAKKWGYAAIYATDIAPFNRELARRMGATEAFDPAQSDAAVEIVKASGGVDAVVVAAGAPNILDQASEMGVKGAKIVLVAMITTPIPVYTYSFVFKEQELLGSMTYTGKDFSAACDLINEGLPVEGIITHKLDMDEAEKGLTILDQKKEDAAKIVVVP